MKKIKKLVWRILRLLGLSGYFAVVSNSHLTEMGWFFTHAKQKSVDKNKKPIPWMTYSFIYFIEKRLKKEFSVFEFGCGSSTIWFAQKVKKVFSVEHNPDWIDKIKENLPQNVSITLEQDPDKYASYINQLDLMFEIIIIDGINRNDCMVKALQNLKPEGVLIIDNVERNEYWSAINNLINRGFKIIEFKGMAPGVSTSSITAILYREGNCLGI